jgi:hypothetical protein
MNSLTLPTAPRRTAGAIAYTVEPAFPGSPTLLRDLTDRTTSAAGGPDGMDT